MSPHATRSYFLTWTSVLPVLSVIVLALAWGRTLPPFVVAAVAPLLAGVLCSQQSTMRRSSRIA